MFCVLCFVFCVLCFVFCVLCLCLCLRVCVCLYLRYLTTKARDILPIEIQVKALDQVGRENKRSRGRTLSIGSSDTQLPRVYNAGHECSTI